MSNVRYQQVVYPQKNAVFLTPSPTKCELEKESECKQILDYRPTPASSCQSTFMPNDRPDPYQCLKACKGIDIYKTDGCTFQNMRFKTRVNNNGCLMSPDSAEYTNMPLQDTLCKRGNCNSKSILTDNYRNAPPPPNYGQKDSSYYDPILWTFGEAYTY